MAVHKEADIDSTAAAYNKAHGRVPPDFLAFPPIVEQSALNRAHNQCAVCGLQRHGANLTVAPLWTPNPADGPRFNARMKVRTFAMAGNAVLLCNKCTKLLVAADKKTMDIINAHIKAKAEPDDDLKEAAKHTEELKGARRTPATSSKRGK